MKKDKKKSIFESIEAVQRSGESVIAWYSLDNQHIQADLKISHVRKFKNDFVIVPDENANFFISQIVSGSEKISLYFPSLSMVCMCRIKKVEANKKMILEYPSHIKHVERRQHTRHSTSDDVSIIIKNGSVEDKKSCFDISTGGFSIFVPSNTKLRVDVHKGPVIVKIKNNSSEINLMCELVNINKIKPFKNETVYYGGSRVSFRFINLVKQQEKEIEEFISNIIPKQKSN